MSFRVLTAASSANLIGLAAVKARLGIEDNTRDALLQALIAGASSAIAIALGRPLGRQRVEESVVGNGRRLLQLTMFPVDVDSVTVEIDGAAITDFYVDEPASGLLRRRCGWPPPCTVEDDDRNIVVTYQGGWVLPDMVANFTASATLAAGSWVRPSSPALSPYLFEVTAGGAAGSTEPVWPTTAGGTVVSGAVTFTARDAKELPAFAQDLAYLAVYDRYENRAPGVAGMSAEGFSEQYFATHTETQLPPAVLAGLPSLRYGVIQ